MKKFLTSVTALALALGMCLSAACTPTKEFGLEIADGNWKNFANEAAEIPPYTITYENDLLVLDYKKTDTWQYVNRVFSENEEDLAKVTTVRMEAKIETTTANPVCLLKVFYTGEGIEYKGNTITEFETAMFTMEKGDYAVYEWDVSEAHFEKALRMDIYVEAGVANVEGKMSIKSLKLTDTVVADKSKAVNNWEKYEPTVEPDDPNAPKTNTISQTAPRVENWYDGGNDAFEVVKMSDGSYDITKKAGANGFESLNANIAGDFIYATQFRMVVSGVNGKNVSVKLFDENTVQSVKEPAETDEVTLTIDLTTVNKETVDDTQPVMVFFQWAGNEEDTTFKIKSAEFVYDVNNINHNSTEVAKWSGGKAFTVEPQTDGSVVITKKAGFSGWEGLKAYLGGDLMYVTQFKMVVSGINGKNFIVKPFDGFEYKVEPATQDELVITIDLTTTTPNLSNPIYVLPFVNDNSEVVTFTIKSAEFVYDVAEITTENTAVNNWNGGTVFTVSAPAEDGSILVTKPEGAEAWGTLRAYVTGEDLADMKTFRITLKGISQKQVIVKPFDNGSIQVEYNRGNSPAPSDEVTIIIDITSVTDFNGVLPILIFFEWDTATETSFTIVSAEFSTEAKPAE